MTDGGDGLDESYWKNPVWRDIGPPAGRAMLARLALDDLGSDDQRFKRSWALTNDAFALADALIEADVWQGSWDRGELVFHLISGQPDDGDDEDDHGDPTHRHLWVNEENAMQDPRVLGLSHSPTQAIGFFLLFLAALSRHRPDGFICPDGLEAQELHAAVLLIDELGVGVILAKGLRNGLFVCSRRPNGWVEWNVSEPRRFWRPIGAVGEGKA